MVGRSLEGQHTCFVCGRTFNWKTIPNSAPGMAVVYEQPKNVATEYAIGKTEQGEVIFEMSCKCPQCGNKNKFETNFRL